MKMTGITTHVINMPLKLDGDVPHVGGQARTALEMLLVRVDTDAGEASHRAGARAAALMHFGHRRRFFCVVIAALSLLGTVNAQT